MKIKNLKLKIIFFGASKFVIPIIDTLKNHFDLSLVITTEKPASKGLAPSDSNLRIKDLQGCPVSLYCANQGIPCISVSNLSDPKIISQLSSLNSQLGVLAYFGLILPKEILELFPHGILNIHPSLLPKYRGPTPGQTAILNNEKKTGVSLMKLDSEVDHGPVLDQIEVDILPTDTSETLYTKLFPLGAKLLEKNIPLYMAGKVKLVEQNHKKATFTERLTRKSGFFDINNPPSKEKLKLMIRAFYPWPGVWTYLQGDPLQDKILKLLPEQRVQIEGKKPMSYKDFINGYPEAKEMLDKLI